MRLTALVERGTRVAQKVFLMVRESVLTSLKVALVHDWLVGMRGGEKVLEALAELFPTAPIYTLVHRRGAISAALEAHPIHTTRLQHVPGGVSHYRHFLPFLPAFMERLRIEPVDLVISVSTCVAKGIVPPPGALHAAYINTPMRYLYDRYDDYFGPGRASLPVRLAMRLVRNRLQRWDQASNARIDSMVGNSHFVTQRIERHYGLKVPVIHPPVAVERFQSLPQPSQSAQNTAAPYYLMVTALVPYKGLELAIEAFRNTTRQLVIVGSGPLLRTLQRRCPTNVQLLGWVDEAALLQWVANCRAYLLPNVEDFGIAPVEAMAAGKPVVALGQGGVRDTVRDLVRWRQEELTGTQGPTGFFFNEPTPQALRTALDQFEQLEYLFDPLEIQRWAERFNKERFHQEIRTWLENLWQQRHGLPTFSSSGVVKTQIQAA